MDAQKQHDCLRLHPLLALYFVTRAASSAPCAAALPEGAPALCLSLSLCLPPQHQVEWYSELLSAAFILALPLPVCAPREPGGVVQRAALRRLHQRGHAGRHQDLAQCAGHGVHVQDHPPAAGPRRQPHRGEQPTRRGGWGRRRPRCVCAMCATQQATTSSCRGTRRHGRRALECHRQRGRRSSAAGAPLLPGGGGHDAGR